MGRDDGPRQHAERHGQPAGRLPRRHLGSDQRPPRPVAVGDDRPRLRPGQDRRPDQPGRLLRPQVQGQHRLPDRDAGHDRADDAQARARPGESDGGRLRRCGRRDQEGAGRGHERAVQGQRVRRGPQERRRRPVDGLVGRHGPGPDRQGVPALHDRRPGRDAVDRQLPDPEGRQERLHRAGHDRLLLRPEDRRPDRGLRELHLPGQGGGRGAAGRRPGHGQQPADLPAAGDPRQAPHLRRASTRRPRSTSTSSSRR